MKILHLTLKKKWFDMILSGEKNEEYREIKFYWTKRLDNRQYDIIRFTNGYSPNSPTMDVEVKSIEKGFGLPQWGAADDQVYILSLGNILSTQNISSPSK